MAILTQHHPRPRIPLVMLTHPFELALGAVLIAQVLRALKGDVTPSLAVLPPWLLIGYFAWSLAGGVGIIVGLCLAQSRTPRPLGAPIGLGTAIERASLYFVSAAYAVLGVMVLANNASRGFGYFLVVGFVAAACLLRAIAIRRTTRAVLDALRRQRRQGGAE